MLDIDCTESEPGTVKLAQAALDVPSELLAGIVEESTQEAQAEVGIKESTEEKALETVEGDDEELEASKDVSVVDTKATTDDSVVFKSFDSVGTAADDPETNAVKNIMKIF